jgi:glycine hydroxymethyltransferase
MHVIAGKAVCFGEALQSEFSDYAAQVVANAKALAAALVKHGFRLVSSGTDNHLLLVDLRERVPDNTGKEVAGWLEQAGMIANHNGIPKDPRPPMQTSGIRLGTPAVTTRGMREPEMVQIATWIDRAVATGDDKAALAAVREEVREFCASFPLPH